MNEKYEQYDNTKTHRIIAGNRRMRLTLRQMVQYLDERKLGRKPNRRYYVDRQAAATGLPG